MLRRFETVSPKFFFHEVAIFIAFLEATISAKSIFAKKNGVTGHFHHDFCDYMSRGIFAKFDIHIEKLVQHTRGGLDASKVFYIAVSSVT